MVHRKNELFYSDSAKLRKTRTEMLDLDHLPKLNNVCIQLHARDVFAKVEKVYEVGKN